MTALSAVSSRRDSGLTKPSVENDSSDSGLSGEGTRGVPLFVESEKFIEIVGSGCAPHGSSYHGKATIV